MGERAERGGGNQGYLIINEVNLRVFNELLMRMTGAMNGSTKNIHGMNDHTDN